MQEISEMITALLKKIPIYKNLVKAVSFARQIRLKLWYLVLPVTLSFLAALFDGLSVGLLIPLGDGIIRGNFDNALNTPILRNIILIFPSEVISSYKNLFIIILLLTFTAAFLNQLLRYSSFIAASLLLRKTANNLRKSIFNKYLKQGKMFFDQMSFGHLNVILQRFTEIIASNSVSLNGYITLIFVVFVFVGMMFVLYWKISIVILLMLPLINRTFKGLMDKLKESSKIYTKQMKDLTKKSYDILTCIPLVRVNALEEKEKEDYARISNAMEKIEHGIDKKVNLIDPLQRMFMLVLVLGAIVILSATANKEAVEVARILVYFYLLREVSVNIGSFNRVRAIINTLGSPVKQIIDMLNMGEQYEVKSGKDNFLGVQDKIEIKNLTFSYIKGKEVLRSLYFSAPKGKMTAIVGPTGSGKTTVINLLLRLYDCPPKSIFIDEKDIRDFQIKSLMSDIALVSQETYLFNDTLKRNIAYGNKNIGDDEILGAIKKARLYDFVKTLPEGLDTRIGDRGIKLSGGEKQRVSIARAIIKKAEILILDEATSALDSKTERMIHEAIKEVTKGKTTIVIAHRLSTIHNADKIVVIDSGSFIEEGTLQELIDKKGKFYEYWQEQKFY